MGPGTRRCRRLTCASQAARRSCRNTAIPLCLQTTREVATGRPAAGGGCPRARRRGLRHELVAEPSNGDFVLVFVALSNHDQSVVAGMALCLRLDYNDWHATRGRTGRGRGWRRNVSSPGCIGTSDPMARVPTGGSNSAPIQVQALFSYIHCHLFTLSGSTYASICRLADPQLSYESSTPTWRKQYDWKDLEGSRREKNSIFD